MTSRQRSSGVVRTPSAVEAAVFVLGAADSVGVCARTGWWLNSGGGVLWMAVTLFVLGALLGSATTVSRYERAAALWLGTMTGLVAMLMHVGPGTLWPIVVGVSCVITASAVTLGTSVARWRQMGRKLQRQLVRESRG
jgi:hypothetical protein